MVLIPIIIITLVCLFVVAIRVGFRSQENDPREMILSHHYDENLHEVRKSGSRLRRSAVVNGIYRTLLSLVLIGLEK